MNYFNNDNVALLEFQEGNAKKGKIKLWHYNYGDNKPETYGWRGVLWYNRKNEDACRLVSRFCDCINRTLDDNATYAQVKNLADFFLDMMGKEMKGNFLKYNL